MKTSTTILLLFLLLSVSAFADEQPPNVILVMTDDQGYAEVGFHGNPLLKTPNLDRFAAEGTELTNFYVSPMCTPTRSSLMTGRYHFRTGAHDTYIGRSNMNPQETTIAEVFADAGYKTAIFGKWHLGENYPMRAVDQGFQHVVVHGGGGIGQFADYPGNKYRDPMLLYNDELKKGKGYCTDVFIDESLKFMEANRDQPFFCYIPLNAPHSPFVVDDEFFKLYESKLKGRDKNWTGKIYGMITQLDGAFQRMLDGVEKMGLRENTIIIFMSDNGPNSIFYTAGLSSQKGSAAENGIRSPFVIQWPKGFAAGRKLNDPAMHIDLLPTLADACGIALPADLKLDGKSILPYLKGETASIPERYLFMQHNRGNLPTKNKNCMVRKGNWKALNRSGKSFQLHDLLQDPGERKDLASEHPEMVKEFASQYEAWFDDVTAELTAVEGKPFPIELNPIQKQDFRFTWQDWWGEETGWRATNYGRWRMNNPGLIERFDVTIVPNYRGIPATVKLIWQDQTIENKFDELPSVIQLNNIELMQGVGFLEAQIEMESEIWGPKEIQIRPAGAESTTPLTGTMPKYNAAQHSKNKKAKRVAAKVNPKKSAKGSMKLPAVQGQFIRIELPGEKRTLSLAEVSVFSKGTNLALKKKATQSTTAFAGTAERAVDGNAEGDYNAGSVTHTNSSANDPWWEVDLGRTADIEQVLIHNRTDSHGERLDGFTLKILDGKRQTVFEKANVAHAPTISFVKQGVTAIKTADVARSAMSVAGAEEMLFPGVKSDFRGYDRYDRIKTSAGHFSVVCPKNPAPGKPWLWRSLFWEAIKKVSDADLKLVDEGYHVVLAHGDVAGHPKGNANIDAAYELLTTEYRFSKKCSMASMSRGTLSLFRWASANPEKVESIYVDNGVCNVLSWPAGKLVPGSGSKASGAPSSWADFKRKFGYATDEVAIKTKESPIDQLAPLAKAGVPILMVCGNKDTAVPYEENDAIMEQRYKALGGSIKVIVEDKGHSHGMNDPTPVLEFIRKHTSWAGSHRPADRIGRWEPALPSSAKVTGQTWIVDSQNDWQTAVADQSNLEFKDGLATPTAKEATFRSTLKTFEDKRSARSLVIDQSPVWHNWEATKITLPNMANAPIALSCGSNDYWLFGNLRTFSNMQKLQDRQRVAFERRNRGVAFDPEYDFENFVPQSAMLEGYDVPLVTTPYPNQYALESLQMHKIQRLPGYHGWHSRDMVNWVYYGLVSKGSMSTTAEFVDGKLYLYYDRPNDRDPHLFIDHDMRDGQSGKDMGMAFDAPWGGSDIAVIRDLNGTFHMISENWDPIDASKRSWDSPLATHAVSEDGIKDFKVIGHAVDHRTKPTGRKATFEHPHWPKGENVVQYEVHEPEQDAYGDWAAIAIGPQYYLFGDFDPAGAHGARHMSVTWFTSSDINKPFTRCGTIGSGHPDPDIMFAEGRFYLVTQTQNDFVSPGPWVETVEARVGVDTDKNGKIDQWTDWTEVKESYDYIKGFSKQIAKTPAELNLSELQAGYGFQFQVRMTDTTGNDSQPQIDKVSLTFSE